VPDCPCRLQGRARLERQCTRPKQKLYRRVPKEGTQERQESRRDVLFWGYILLLIAKVNHLSDVVLHVGSALHSHVERSPGIGAHS
jgi:hypothetical protein